MRTHASMRRQLRTQALNDSAQCSQGSSSVSASACIVGNAWALALKQQCAQLDE